ncbi:Succinate--CoA ligase [ADP-forming] subunit alpha, mitochondrial [Pseudocercospora fuligena]|uniref:Succinate--CoA ligase [ADP-forming] subunit alpha, mitochondrial n=1 Tax=Pseudocercospora fuligena TaxID=685502 RepID=A0A8H6RQN5_9PEZI|nr:Succinate--CoA ligase [ADP-forming] subunit alpha, mitochondrial [Pseudocercospora fuligena]
MASTIRCSQSSSLLSSAARRTQSTARRAFSSSPLRAGYDDTVQNLRIGKHTRVIYQGFTGRVATGNAKDSLAYGTNIVGGVTPGKEGEHIGLPLLPDLKRAMKELKPDATAVFVAAPQCGQAIEQAIEAEIPLIVSVAEHIPVHDMMRVASILKTQSKSRLVGANAPGIIAPIGFCRIGFQPLPTFAPGHIGIAAKSGTLSYEAVASISRAGLGQSLVIGMGGDIVAGTNLVDALKVFEADPETEGIVLIGEVGGRAEEDAAEWIKDYLKREKNPKPIAALVGGKCARPNTIMGHAGAWAARGERDSHGKYSVLHEAGATMVDHPEDFGGVMKTILKQSGRDVSKIQQNVQSNQKRGYHTLRRSPAMQRAARRPTAQQGPVLRPRQEQQHRNLHIAPELTPVPLYPYLSKVKGLALSLDEAPKDSYYVGIIVDRTERGPCIAVAPTGDSSQIDARVKRFPYDYQNGPSQSDINVAIEYLQMTSAPQTAKEQVSSLISSLATMYKEKEAIILSGCVSIGGSGNLKLHQPSLTLMFDDSAYRTKKRQEDVHRLRQKEKEVPEEVEAEQDGIVYVKFENEQNANIGTLVNGAGLAMNTVDALRLHGGIATNFLDTGGKATSETVKKSFQLILQDPRVKVIFVNIFGGLTDGGMIANGILLAFKEVDMKNTPVVVRIRGTNEEEGQKIIAESGLGLDAFDKFEDAAKRVIEIANK